jgi:hypothetical protein
MNAETTKNHVEDIAHEMVNVTEIGGELETKKTEVLELEAETVDAVISREVVKFAMPDSAIAQLKEQFGGLAINGVEDREGYKKVQEAWRLVRSKRLEVEKKHTVLKADYLQIGRAIDGEKNRLVGLLKPLENSLGQKLEDIDAAIREEKEREERERQQRLQGRVAELLENGMKFSGQYYTIGETISMDVVTLKNFTDPEYQYFLERVKTENKKILDAEAEQKRLEQEERDRLIKQQEEQEAERLKLKAQREELQREQEQMKQARIDLRAQILINAGLSKTHLGTFLIQFPDCGNVEVFENDFSDLTGDQWDAKFSEIKTQVQTLRQVAAEKQEQKRQEEEQRQRELKLKQELQARFEQRAAQLVTMFGMVPGGFENGQPTQYARSGRFNVAGMFLPISEIRGFSDDEWNAALADAKIKFQKMLNDEIDQEKKINEQKEADRLAAMSDVEKVKDFVLKLEVLARDKPTLKNKKILAAWDLFGGAIDTAKETLLKTLELI